MAGILETWKKHQTIPFVDIDPLEGGQYVRIGKSTIFDLTFNANTEEYDFIEDENPTTLIRNYKPSMGQELRTVKGDPAFMAMYEMMYSLPTGDEAVRNTLLVFPNQRNGDGAYDAWLVPTTVVLTNFNTVDEKILFDLNFNGTIRRGTVTIAKVNGVAVPTWTEGDPSDPALFAVTPPTATVAPGGSRQFNASAPASWSIDSVISTISGNGLLAVDASEIATTITVTATAATSGATATAVVTITP